MTPIYPSVALKTKQRELKDIANNEFVYITERGCGKYIFASEEVINRHVEEAVENALYEQRVAEAMKRSRKDVAEGRYYEDRESLYTAAAKERAANAQC